MSQNNDQVKSSDNRKTASRSKSAGERLSSSFRKRPAIDDDDEGASSSSSSSSTYYPLPQPRQRPHPPSYPGKKQPQPPVNFNRGNNKGPNKSPQHTRPAVCSPTGSLSNASTDSSSGDYPNPDATISGSSTLSQNAAHMFAGDSSPRELSPTAATDSDDSGCNVGAVSSKQGAPPAAPLKRLRLSSESSSGSPIHIHNAASVRSAKPDSSDITSQHPHPLSAGGHLRPHHATPVDDGSNGYATEREAPDGRKRRFLKTADILRKSGLLHVTLRTADLIKANEILDREIAAFKREVQDLMDKVARQSYGNSDDVDEAVSEEEEEEDCEEMASGERTRNSIVRSKNHRCSIYGSGDVKDTKSEFSYQSLDSGMGSSVISEDIAQENQF